MASFSPTLLYPLDAGEEYYGTSNASVSSNNSHSNDDPEFIYRTVTMYIVCVSIIIVCIWGCLGNGTVIWLLGFRIQRTPFTTYILNLAISDFGLLAVDFILEIRWLQNRKQDEGIVFEFFEDIFQSMYNTGQFLLTAISIDRCVCILFPFWYRCHRPRHLSTILCALIWIFSFIFPGIHFILFLTAKKEHKYISCYQYIVNGFICLPLMTFSTLILFIKFCFKTQRIRRRKLITVILLTLLFFLSFSFPLNAFYISHYIFDSPTLHRIQYGYLCATLNSSVNPLIYFLVGRPKRGKPRRSMKVILQNVFKEEESHPDEMAPSAETKL
uniref:mas-related G-protein coupled receptor member H-like n=1 Tax=Podarcis muralis TaxID=64176 RepID=UPI0010A0433B|nr:mas-related G-protein coupled receptor member H-like [Podarcis muralis]